MPAWKPDLDREIEVEFLTTLNEEMPWKFKASTNKVVVHPGEPTRVTFVARNLTDKSMVGQAIPSIAPGTAAQYFKKTECFCFSQQTLKAGEEKTMPVVFIIDPAIPDDVHEISLSYTFFITPGSENVENTAKQTVSAHNPLASNLNQEI